MAKKPSAPKPALRRTPAPQKKPVPHPAKPAPKPVPPPRRPPQPVKPAPKPGPLPKKLVPLSVKPTPKVPPPQKKRVIPQPAKPIAKPNPKPAPKSGVMLPPIGAVASKPKLTAPTSRAQIPAAPAKKNSSPASQAKPIASKPVVRPLASSIPQAKSKAANTPSGFGLLIAKYPPLSAGATQARPSAVGAATPRPSTASGVTATRIRVDLSVMRGSAGGINNVGNATSNVAGKLTGVAARAPSYDGQFGPRVQAIAGQSASLAGGIAGRLGGLSGKLNSKANAFEAVDTAALSSVKTLTVPVAPSGGSNLQQLANLLKVPISELMKYLGLGALGIFKAISDLFVTPVYADDGTASPKYKGSTFQRLPSTLSTLGTNVREWVERKINQLRNYGPYTNAELKQQKVDAKRKADEEVIRKAEEAKAKRIAEEKRNAEEKRKAEHVPAGVGENGNYWRNAFGDQIVSNCTWYAAAAVKQASGGKIDLNNAKFVKTLGHGGQWSTNARELMGQPNSIVKDVNQIPAVGAVYNKPGQNHVAFVEEVRTIKSPDGVTKYEVVISEENAGYETKDGPAGMGEPIAKDSTSVNVEGDTAGKVRRYRRTITFSAEPGSDPPKISTNYGVNFIHFKY